MRAVNEIVLGKRAVTAETAQEIGAALGTSAQLWMNLETSYRLSRLAPVEERISREAALRERFPVHELRKRAWIRETKDYEELEATVLAYFGLKSVFDPFRFAHAARRNYGEDLSSRQVAWLIRVQQMAAVLHVSAYSSDKLRSATLQLERLMTEPEEIQHVPRILAECGVRLVIVEPIPGSQIQGVCFWINDGKSPVIGLTLKGDQIDKFWFDLWHEITHVLREDGKDEPVLDDFDNPSDEAESERAANEGAAHHCVPRPAMRDFIARHNPMFSERSLIGFARLMKRHPGIVAGQLQRHTKRWDLFKKLQPRVRR